MLSLAKMHCSLSIQPNQPTIVSNIVISFAFFSRCFLFRLAFFLILDKSLTKDKQINKMEHEFYNIYECFNALVRQ